MDQTLTLQEQGEEEHDQTLITEDQERNEALYRIKVRSNKLANLVKVRGARVIVAARDPCPSRSQGARLRFMRQIALRQENEALRARLKHVRVYALTLTLTLTLTVQQRHAFRPRPPPQYELCLTHLGFGLRLTLSLPGARPDRGAQALPRSRIPTHHPTH